MADTEEKLYSNDSNKVAKTKIAPPANLGFFGCFFDADLLAYKGFCFFLYGAYGGFIPYLPLYFKQLGLGADYSGTLVGIRPLIQCLAAPLFGVLANRFRAGKVLLLGGIFAWIIKALMILAVTPHDQHCIKMLENDTANTTYVYAYNLWDFNEHNDQWVLLPLHRPVLIQENKITIVDKEGNVQQEAATSEVPNEIAEPLEQDRISQNQIVKPTAKPTAPTLAKNESAARKRTPHDKPQAYGGAKKLRQPFHKRTLLDVDAPEQAILAFADLGKVITADVAVFDPKLNQSIKYITQIDSNEVHDMFIIFLLVIIIGEFLESPAYGLSDASLLKRLGDHRDYYGRIRMWGSLGWCMASLLVGGIIYSTRFYLCAVLQNNYLVTFYVFIAMVAAAFANALWYKFDYSDNDSAVKKHDSMLSKVAETILSVRHCSFLLGALYIGMCYGLLVHFLNWYIDDMGGSTLIMGVAGAAREVGGIAFFFISGPVIRSLGNVNTMLLCVLAYIVCFLCYAVLYDPWITPALQLLDGATYALAWSNSVSYMGMLGDPLGMVETTQGILQGVFWGLGNGGGTMIAGVLYHHYGGVVTFRIFAGIGAVVIALLCISSFITNRIEEKATSAEGYQPLAKGANVTNEQDDEDFQ